MVLVNLTSKNPCKSTGLKKKIQKLNYYKIRFYANSNNKTVFLCKTEDKVIKKGCDNTLNKRVKSIIRLSEEKDTKNLMTNLPLVFGGANIL